MVRGEGGREGRKNKKGEMEGEREEVWREGEPQKTTEEIRG